MMHVHLCQFHLYTFVSKKRLYTKYNLHDPPLHPKLQLEEVKVWIKNVSV